MTSEEKFCCDICCLPEKTPPELDCCGIKYCFSCVVKTCGLCHVCKKDELNDPLQCEVCGDVKSGFITSKCGGPECETLVCITCDKNDFLGDMPWRFCSENCIHEFFAEDVSEE